MENLESLFGLLPPAWMASAGTVLAVLIALRTVLRGIVGLLYAIDFALDGSYDWAWVGVIGDKLDWFDDHVLDRLPVKALALKGKGKPS